MNIAKHGAERFADLFWNVKCSGDIRHVRGGVDSDCMDLILKFRFWLLPESLI